MSGYAAYSGDGPATQSTSVDSTMAKQTATEIWNVTFNGQTSVTANTFAKGMAKHFAAAYKQPLYSPEGISLTTPPSTSGTGGYGAGTATTVFPCLFNAALAATGAFTTTGGETSITRDAWLLFLARFGGGLNRYSVRDSAADAVRNLFDIPTSDASVSLTSAPVDRGNEASLVEWLHSTADVGSNVDTLIVESSKTNQGTFILRFSSSRPSQLAMDFIGPYENKPKKLLIERVGDGWMKSGGQTSRPTLQALAQSHVTSMGPWIVSALSKRFKGSSNGAPADGTHAAAIIPSQGGGAYQMSGLEAGMGGVQILSVGGAAPSAGGAYAAGPIGSAPAPVQPAPAQGGYAASFDPAPSAAPVLASPSSGYAASFVGADLPPASSPQSLQRHPSTQAILPFPQRVLFYAVAIGDLLAIQSHCSACEGCGVTDGWGLSAVHVACANDQPEALRLLKSHVPEAFWRANVTTAISVADGQTLSAYSWQNRCMPYWPAKTQTQELSICNPRALALEYGGADSSCLKVLDELGIEASLLLERAPSASRVEPQQQTVQILGGGPASGASRYMAQ